MKRHDNYAYDTVYESSPKQKERRARRNRDRRRMLREGKVHKGDTIDVHHQSHEDLEDVMLVPRSKNRSTTR